MLRKFLTVVRRFLKVTRMRKCRVEGGRGGKVREWYDLMPLDFEEGSRLIN